MCWYVCEQMHFELRAFVLIADCLLHLLTSKHDCHTVMQLKKKEEKQKVKLMLCISVCMYVISDETSFLLLFASLSLHVDLRNRLLNSVHCLLHHQTHINLKMITSSAPPYSLSPLPSLPLCNY